MYVAVIASTHSLVFLQDVSDHGGDVVSRMRLSGEEDGTGLVPRGHVAGVQLQEVAQEQVELLVHLTSRDRLNVCEKWKRQKRWRRTKQRQRETHEKKRKSEVRKEMKRETEGK